MVETLKKEKGVESIVFDGIITGRLVETALNRGIKTIIGERIAGDVSVPPDLTIKAFKEL
jgi:hypothetical protein